MSEAVSSVSFRDELDIPAESANDNQTTLQIDLKIEPKPEILTEAEKQDELEKLKAIKSEEKLQKPENNSGDTSEGVSKEPAEKQESNRVRESDVLGEAQDLGGLGDGPDLESGSSFTSCCSYKYIRKSILQREPHSSTLSINIENLVNSSPSLPEATTPTPTPPPAEALPDSTATSSVQLLMEQRSLSYTSDCSDDFEIGIGEVYQRFASLFSRTEIDVAYSNFTQVDEDLDGYICLSELKRALEKLEIPQTHLAAKKVMTHVIGSDEDRLNFCQMLLIYGTLMHRVEVQKYSFHDKVGQRLAMTDAVDVSQVGVTGARIFFEAKIAQQQQQEPIVLSVFDQELPVTRTPRVASAEIRTSSSHKEQFKGVTALFKKLESDH